MIGDVHAIAGAIRKGRWREIGADPVEFRLHNCSVEGDPQPNGVPWPRIGLKEVLEQVRGDPQLSSTPIVMLTSSREEQDLVRSYELGVNAFVVKPVDFKEFFDAIQGLGMFWGITNQPPPHRPNGSGQHNA